MTGVILLLMSDFLLPFRFVATFLVPSVYSTMLGTLALLLAQFGPPPEASATSWSLNALAWLGALTLLATLALTLKKLFGRQPTINEILSGLVSVKTLAEYKEEQRIRCVGLETQISAARHAFDERVNTDLKRTMEIFADIFQRSEQRDKTISRMSDTMSRLQERTETHLRKFDQYDTKMDNILREVSAAAATLREAGKRQG